MATPCHPPGPRWGFTSFKAFLLPYTDPQNQTSPDSVGQEPHTSWAHRNRDVTEVSEHLEVRWQYHPSFPILSKITKSLSPRWTHRIWSFRRNSNKQRKHLLIFIDSTWRNIDVPTVPKHLNGAQPPLLQVGCSWKPRASEKDSKRDKIYLKLNKKSMN